MSDVLIPVQVILQLFTLTNGLLNNWVMGNNITDSGGLLLESLARIIEGMANVFALIWNLA